MRKYGWVAGWIAAILVATSIASQAATPLTTVRVARSLTQPLFVTHAPGDFHRIFIVEQTGRIKIRRNGLILSTPFLDVDALSLSGNERGLLGMAFHPRYAENGFFYINYTDNLGDTIVARYSVSSDPDRANPPDTGVRILRIDEPNTSQFHNGGWMGFGPDGFLYIARGDGGAAGSPATNAQDTTDNLLGKLLRIDVDRDDFPNDADRHYGIPADNPFVGLDGDDEIWAYGLRNPWRCAFDAATGDLFIADVGEATREEINFEPADSTGGRNYGWRCMEGSLCTGFTGCTCADASLELPIYEYVHDAVPHRCSITGGEVYRGCAIPDLTGSYFFADFCSSNIWSLTYAPPGPGVVTDRTTELDPGHGLVISGISSFGLDAAGEIYICDRPTGEVYKVVADRTVSVVESVPPSQAIDARRPIDPETGEAHGWNQIDLHFSNSFTCLTSLDIFVSEEPASTASLNVDSVSLIDETRATVTLSRAVRPLTWTNIVHEASMATIRVGFLPADVNADGVSDASDVLSLIEELNGSGTTRPQWSTDVDRSGIVSTSDLLEAVDLLNGAGAYDAYLGASLP